MKELTSGWPSVCLAVRLSVDGQGSIVGAKKLAVKIVRDPEEKTKISIRQ